MIEWLFIPIFLSSVAFIPNWEMSDKKKIQNIFKNVGYGVRKKDHIEYPIYKRTSDVLDGETVIGFRYSFSVPLGLPATKMKGLEEDIKVFSDGIRKPVIIDFDGLLHVKVFNEEIPPLFKYADVPESNKAWEIPLGKGLEGLAWHNFDYTPHMTVAGTTRFGKTVFLRSMLTYLIERNPDDVEFHIIDLKGGLEFGRYECIKQIKGVASDAEEAAEMLQGILENVKNDYILFRKRHWSNIVDTPLKRRRFVIVDEAAQLAPEKWMDAGTKKLLGYCQYALGEISRIAGALGYREIFCTQYPTSDTLPRSIKQNADAKISFRLPSGYASDVAIDSRGAEELPSNIKGRAMFKTHELTELQTPYLSHEEMWERLAKYQEPVILEGEAENVIEQERVDLVQFG